MSFSPRKTVRGFAGAPCTRQRHAEGRYIVFELWHCQRQMTARRQVFYDVIHDAPQHAYSGESDGPAATFHVVRAALCAALGPQSSPLLYCLVLGMSQHGVATKSVKLPGLGLTPRVDGSERPGHRITACFPACFLTTTGIVRRSVGPRRCGGRIG